jgi:hypothetical protein
MSSIVITIRVFLRIKLCIKVTAETNKTAFSFTVIHLYQWQVLQHKKFNEIIISNCKHLIEDRDEAQQNK